MQKMTDGNDSGTKIKICGLRRREDILAVNEAKPDYCGFIIEFPSSFRSVTADEVRELVKELDPEIRPVGVFVNAPMELVRTLLDDGTLALAQLHGQEDESYIRELKTYTDKLIIKAFSIKTAEDIEKALQSPADYILLDQGGGGTIAYITANYGMDVIDSGVALLSMHSPWEISSKADIYEAYKGYKAFQKADWAR